MTNVRSRDCLKNLYIHFTWQAAEFNEDIQQAKDICHRLLVNIINFGTTLKKENIKSFFIRFLKLYKLFHKPY